MRDFRGSNLERLFMNDFIEGMHKTGEAMSAVISAQVTKEAQDKMARAGAPDG